MFFFEHTFVFFSPFFIDLSQTLLFMVLLYASTSCTLPVKQTLGKDCVRHAEEMLSKIEEANRDVRLQCRLTGSLYDPSIPSEICIQSQWLFVNYWFFIWQSSNFNLGYSCGFSFLFFCGSVRKTCTEELTWILARSWSSPHKPQQCAGQRYVFIFPWDLWSEHWVSYMFLHIPTCAVLCSERLFSSGRNLGLHALEKHSWNTTR